MPSCVLFTKILVINMSELKAALYVRVSTDKQSYENQIAELTNFCKARGYTVAEVYKETISGKEAERPEFKRMLEDAAKHKFDAIVVWALDRFTREGTGKVWHYLSLLRQYNVAFISYTESYLNTDNELVRDVLFSILGALAKQERLKISQRTKSALELVKARGSKSGRPIGRPKTYTAEQEAKAKELRAQGQSYNAIAKALGLNPGIVYKILTKGMKTAREQKSTNS